MASTRCYFIFGKNPHESSVQRVRYVAFATRWTFCWARDASNSVHQFIHFNIYSIFCFVRLLVCAPLVHIGIIVSWPLFHNAPYEAVSWQWNLLNRCECSASIFFSLSPSLLCSACLSLVSRLFFIHFDMNRIGIEPFGKNGFINRRPASYARSRTSRYTYFSILFIIYFNTCDAAP